MEQEYELGAWIRKRYQNTLIDEHYRFDQVLMNSSDYDRCLMSAECFLAGLYPPRFDDLWNKKNLTWQPIPVHTRPREQDNVSRLIFFSLVCKIQ